MSPLNRGPLLGPRVPPAGVRPLPPPRFGGRLVPPGMPPRMPPPPINPAFGPMRQRLLPPRPGGVSRPNGLLPLFPPRARGMPPIIPPIGLRGSGVPRGPLMRPWPRILSPQMMPPMRPRFVTANSNVKGKAMNNAKKVNKLEELELKKPWMTDEIRSEIQKKNKLYTKAKKNQDAVEWKEFKDLRNKVTRMIRDAKNEYLTKHPEQAHLYVDDEEPYDQRDENNISSEDDTSYYCEICDRDLPSKDAFSEHNSMHKLCGIDGCTFSAHPLLVEKHINMQHSTGLYHRMKNLSNPEDIEKWLLERKRRYPTKANIELRKAEELEKVRRGEIIKKSAQTKTKLMNIRDKKHKSRKQHRRMINNNYSHTNEIYRGLRPFSGTNILRENSNDVCVYNQEKQTDYEEIIGNISDEDDLAHTSSEAKSFDLYTPTLVANYGNGTDEDDGPEETPINKIKIEEHQDNQIVENIKNDEGTSIDMQLSTVTSYKPNKQPIKFDTTCRNSSGKRQCKQEHETNGIMKNNKNRKSLHRYHNILLQKLLSDSIQHERNLICQCVKYIVDNNFFNLA